MLEYKSLKIYDTQQMKLDRHLICACDRGRDNVSGSLVDKLNCRDLYQFILGQWWP